MESDEEYAWTMVRRRTFMAQLMHLLGGEILLDWGRVTRRITMPRCVRLVKLMRDAHLGCVRLSVQGLMDGIACGSVVPGEQRYKDFIPLFVSNENALLGFHISGTVVMKRPTVCGESDLLRDMMRSISARYSLFEVMLAPETFDALFARPIGEKHIVALRKLHEWLRIMTLNGMCVTYKLPLSNLSLGLTGHIELHSVKWVFRAEVIHRSFVEKWLYMARETICGYPGRTPEDVDKLSRYLNITECPAVVVEPVELLAVERKEAERVRAPVGLF